MATPFHAELLGIQFFGEFLIDRWVITREQLLEALAMQDERNLKFGAIALKKKFLTQEQMDAISLRQRTTDSSVGDLAVTLGYLTSKQRQEILTYQKNNNLFLGQALLRLGYIEEDALERELRVFRELQARYVMNDIDLPPDLPGAEVLRASLNVTRTMFRRMLGMHVKVGKGLQLKTNDDVLQLAFRYSVVVELEGGATVQYILSVSSAVAILIASSILNEDAAHEPDETIVDAVKEFCNIVCGNTAAKLAQQGIQLDLAPPNMLRAVPLATDPAFMVAFPMRLTAGSADLRFVVQRAGS
jgi:CheY-specific phosphatase CheX